MLVMKGLARAACVFALLVAAGSPPARAASGEITNGSFRFAYDERGILGLANPNDPFGVQVTASDRPLQLILRGRAGEGEWTDLSPSSSEVTVAPGGGAVTYKSAGSDGQPQVVQTFQTDGKALDWTIELTSASRAPITVGDLGISIPAVPPRARDPRQIFEGGFLQHQFISGAGSFFYYVRASGAPPFLMVTVHPGTKLEYFTGGGRGGGQVFVHSAASGPDVDGTWRQEHTALTLGPARSKNSTARYGFRFRWANSYDELRDILNEEGLFDIRVAPGMTVPEDLTTRLALRTRAKIESIEAEFPDQTTISELGEKESGHRVYEIAFRHLGENMLTIHHDGGRETYLEFFATEPLETLIKKRTAFIVNRQQIRDSSKWWDGVYGPYDMKNKVTRTIDDPDIFTGRMIYVLTCDDPGLSKAPLIAAKNVLYPDKKEIESLEYYLEHFVWGGLQRTDDERPYPYGVYGTPHWYMNRDPERRKAYTDRDLDKEHVWRSYDYPHIVMLYFHMYQIAKMYPEMSEYLDAPGYLQRAWETARAFFTYPYEIYPSYYDTYKWGLYNELIVPQLADVLDEEGFSEQATWLHSEWEKKVKYFVYDDLYPFRSEYAFDRTAFESTYAFAKYGATHEMKPDKNLWYDLRLKKWYSHPLVRREDSRRFMERQLAANLSVRGWLEASYYRLGSDPSMSYMAAMGGWGILDYALNFASNPHDWLQLGYASYLSSWSLMNTGRPDTNYGYWFPGPENDGAAGWQFMSSKRGNAWMGGEVPRGPWHYDGEIDLGYGGALRMASTIVTRDPVFDWIAYGGTLDENGEMLSVVPRDGVRTRFGIVLKEKQLPFPAAERLRIELDRDGFAKGETIALDKTMSRIAFTIENRTGDAHSTGMRLHFPVSTRYEVRQDGEVVPLSLTGKWEFPHYAELAMPEGPSKIEIVRLDEN